MNDTTEAEQTAERIKSTIIESCTYVSKNDVRVTTDISEYHGYVQPNGFVNRNAGPGELATWVLVEVPDIPQVRSDSYYNQNPHRTKPTEEGVERTKNMVEMIKGACQTAASVHGAEYIGYNTPSKGFDSSKGNTRYLNIRVE